MYQSNQVQQVTESILKCPNFVYAAVIMNEHGFYNGRGDFHKIIKQICSKFDPNIKDLAAKLMLLRTGGIFSESKYPVMQFGKFSCEFGEGLKQEIQHAKDKDKFFKIYSDKVPQRIKQKYIFRIWREWIYLPRLKFFEENFNIFGEEYWRDPNLKSHLSNDNLWESDKKEREREMWFLERLEEVEYQFKLQNSNYITTEDLKIIFPEIADKITYWDECCNGEGYRFKNPRNIEYAKQYEKSSTNVKKIKKIKNKQQKKAMMAI